MHAFDGCLSFIFSAHRDEPEAAGTAGCPVSHQMDFKGGSELIKSFLNFAIRDVERDVPNVQFVIHVLSESVAQPAIVP